MRVEHKPAVKLKKELGVLGSFSIGFADVGADIFLALGLIAAYAGGAMPLAILIAALVYACTGLAYAELASAIPVTGGAAAYGRRAFGNLVGFIGGWGLILDYIICISLFAVASAGYLSFFFPIVRLYFPFATAGIILFLIIINLLGIRESSSVNVALTLFTVAIVLGLFAVGFSFSFDFSKLLSAAKPIEHDVGWNNFLYSITLAMVTFIGIESISQAAEETKEPGRIIPRASALAVFLVILFALAMSVMALGIVSPQQLAERIDNPLVAIALALPFSNLLVPVIAFAGFMICLVSSNTGVIGVSRVVYSMSKSELISRRLRWLHPKFQTPWLSIIIFSTLALLLAFLADLRLLGELYAFGALTAYLIVNLSLLAIRVQEPNLHRPFSVPLNINIQGRRIPLISLIGVLGCMVVFALVAALHEQGRVFAGAWFLAGFLIFASYQKYREYIPEIDIYFEEKERKRTSCILVPTRFARQSADIADLIAPVARQTGLPVTILHVVELPPTVPMSARITVSEDMREFVAELAHSLELQRVKVKICARGARTAVEGIMDFTKECDVKMLFVLRDSREPQSPQSKLLLELEQKTDVLMLVYTI
ncbi:MAG: universal stress protein [Candidatus Micrarchaeota archaeon]